MIRIWKSIARFPELRLIAVHGGRSAFTLLQFMMSIILLSGVLFLALTLFETLQQEANLAAQREAATEANADVVDRLKSLWISRLKDAGSGYSFDGSCSSGYCRKLVIYRRVVDGTGAEVGAEQHIFSTECIEDSQTILDSSQAATLASEVNVSCPIPAIITACKSAPEKVIPRLEYTRLDSGGSEAQAFHYPRELDASSPAAQHKRAPFANFTCFEDHPSGVRALVSTFHFEGKERKVRRVATEVFLPAATSSKLEILAPEGSP